MKAIAGSILILAASIILAAAIPEGAKVLSNASIFVFPLGIVGITILAWGLFEKNPKDKQ